MMSPAQHYAKACELLEMVHDRAATHRNAGATGPMATDTAAHRLAPLIALAQVHMLGATVSTGTYVDATTAAKWDKTR